MHSLCLWTQVTIVGGIRQLTLWLLVSCVCRLADETGSGAMLTGSMLFVGSVISVLVALICCVHYLVVILVLKFGMRFGCATMLTRVSVKSLA